MNAVPGPHQPNAPAATDQAQLSSIAARLCWWTSPVEALKDESRFLAQVMALGTWDDVQLARKVYSQEKFSRVLTHPPTGVFDARSWHYWHHVFGLLPVPPLPQRTIP